MAIKEPKTVNRRGEKLKKTVGDRSYSVAKAIIFGGVCFIVFAVLCFISKQWVAGITFLVATVAGYYPYKYLYRYPATAVTFQEDGLLVYDIDDKTTFVPFTKLYRVTLFNPDARANLFFSSRRSVFITLKQEEGEEEAQVVRIFFPYEAETLYYKILKAKLDFDGIPAEK